MAAFTAVFMLSENQLVAACAWLVPPKIQEVTIGIWKVVQTQPSAAH